MAKKLKKEIKKILDNTDIDDKLVDVYQDAKASGLLDKIKCYVKCYGGYVLAVGAGCLFGVNFWWGLGFLTAAGVWAYKITACPIK